MQKLLNWQSSTGAPLLPHTSVVCCHVCAHSEFLTSYVDILDVNTTTSLLATYGRLDELTHFAAARNDHEGLLEFLMQRPDGAARQAHSYVAHHAHHRIKHNLALDVLCTMSSMWFDG